MAKITTQLPGTIITGSVITKTSELINDGDTGVSTYVEFTDIGLVAESNDYNDLTNLPNIPTNLDSLTDVTINSTLNNDFLQFDSITSLWKNIQLTGALILSKLGFTPENVSNKQNNLTIDGTGLKYPTVDAVNNGLALKADISSINTQLYAAISANTTLDNTYHGKQIWVTATCNITIPSGLRSDFNCTFRTFTGVTATFLTSGTVINSESDTSVIGAKKMCYVAVYTTNNYIISGGL